MLLRGPPGVSEHRPHERRPHERLPCACRCQSRPFDPQSYARAASGAGASLLLTLLSGPCCPLPPSPAASTARLDAAQCGGALTSSWARRNMASLVNSAMMFLTGMLDTWSMGYSHSPCLRIRLVRLRLDTWSNCVQPLSLSPPRVRVCLPPLHPLCATVGGRGRSKPRARAEGELGMGGTR